MGSNLINWFSVQELVSHLIGKEGESTVILNIIMNFQNNILMGFYLDNEKKFGGARNWLLDV